MKLSWWQNIAKKTVKAFVQTFVKQTGKVFQRAVQNSIQDLYKAAWGEDDVAAILIVELLADFLGVMIIRGAPPKDQSISRR